jgi:dipeptidyl aminopeptidase/acylaminoacyl peptidase
MSFRLLVILLLGFISISVAQVRLEDLMSVPFPTNLISSRDGSKIAWISNDKGVRNIWIADAPDFKPKKITPYSKDDGQELSSLVFSPEGDKIYFVKGGAPNSQNELPNPLSLQEEVERAIWSASLDGELKKLAQGFYPKLSPDGKTIAYLSTGQIYSVPADAKSEGKKLFSARGNQHSIRWSPDGRRIAFISNRTDHSFLGIFEMSSKQVLFPDPSVDHDDDPVWADNNRIFFTRTPNVKNRLPFSPALEGSPWSIRMTSLSELTSTEIWRASPGRGSVLHDGVPAVDNKIFWADQKIIFPWEMDGWVHYYSIPETGGKPLLLTSGHGEVELASLSADRKFLIYTSNIGDIDRRHISKVSLSSGDITQVTEGNGIEWGAVETKAGIVFTRSDAVTAAWLWQLNEKGPMKMIVTELFPQSFPKGKLVTPQPVSVIATDGMKIPGQLFLPSNYKSDKKYPAVIFFHGGSKRQMLLGFNYGQYYHHAYSMNQYLASQGYIVLSLNYRSGIGYGLDFREARDYGAAGASEYNDVKGAGEFLKARSDVDGSRIGLWGGSYGGYLTALGLARAPELFSCGVDIHGVHDWNVVIKNFVPSYLAEKHAEFSKKAFESSPMNFIKGWKAPVLLIHGDDDRNVPFSETVSLAESLREQNVYFEQLIFPDEVHSFLLHENWLRAYRASADFFHRQFSKRDQAELVR